MELMLTIVAVVVCIFCTGVLIMNTWIKYRDEKRLTHHRNDTTQIDANEETKKGPLRPLDLSPARLMVHLRQKRILFLEAHGDALAHIEALQDADEERAKVAEQLEALEKYIASEDVDGIEKTIEEIRERTDCVPDADRRMQWIRFWSEIRGYMELITLDIPNPELQRFAFQLAEKYFSATPNLERVQTDLIKLTSN